MIVQARGVLLTWAAVAAVVVSQGALYSESLGGRILDPSGSAVPRASLRLFDRDTGRLRQTTSAADGSFEFQGIPDGDYLLEAEAASAFLAASREITVQGDSNLDIELAISGANVEVLVTASGTAQSIEETAKAIDVVTADEIALRNEIMISEAIRNIPGVRVQTQEGPGSLTTIQTRGVSTTRPCSSTACVFATPRARRATRPRSLKP